MLGNPWFYIANICNGTSILYRNTGNKIAIGKIFFANIEAVLTKYKQSNFVKKIILIFPILIQYIQFLHNIGMLQGIHTNHYP